MTARTVPTAPLPSLDLTKYEGHTPGPWSKRKYGVIIGGVVREYVNGSSQDQIVMACNVQDDNGGALAMERNTLLMGDAPQLLAALLAMQRERDEARDRLFVCYQLAALSPGLKKPEGIEEAVNSVRELRAEHYDAVEQVNALRDQLAASERTCAELRWQLISEQEVQRHAIASAEAAERTVQGLRVLGETFREMGIGVIEPQRLVYDYCADQVATELARMEGGDALKK